MFYSYHTIGVALVVYVSVSHVVVRVFAFRPGHIKYHNKNGTNYLPPWHAGIMVGLWQCNPTVNKGRVKCGSA